MGDREDLTRSDPISILCVPTMRMHQLLAYEKNAKTKANAEATAQYHLLQKEALFNGFTKSYRKKDEEGEHFPDEGEPVQARVREALQQVAKSLGPMFDLVASKDTSNQNARADVVVTGAKLLTDIPVTTLLFIEKQVADLKPILEALPELPTNEAWTYTENLDLFVTQPKESHKTKKKEYPVTLAPATEHHPAQVAIRAEDVVIGYWTTVKQSSALPKIRKQELLDRLALLTAAVKVAREAANQVEVKQVNIGEAIFNYLLEPLRR